MKTTEQIIEEIKWRLAIIHDQLIGQSPEDMERHWKLMSAQDTLKELLEFIQK